MVRNAAALSIAILLSQLAFFPASTHAAPPDLETFAERLERATLDFSRAVDARGFELSVAFGSLSLGSGFLVPSKISEDGTVRELIFSGNGRLRVDPPDAIEAQQLFQLQGNDRIDLQVVSGVLVVASGELAGRLAERTVIAVPDQSRGAIARLHEQWVAVGGREEIGATRALLGALAGDPLALGFVNLWLETPERGWVFYRFDPSSEEPVTAGAFELFDEDDFKTRARKRFETALDRAESKRKRKYGEIEVPEAIVGPARCGADADATDDEEEQDEEEPWEWIRVWMSSPPPGADASAESPGLEPYHYEIDLALTEEAEGLLATGTARLHLRASTDGLRALPLTLGSSLELCDVRDSDGTSLKFVRRDWQVLVALAEPTVAGEELTLDVHFGGYPIDHWAGKRLLRHSVNWHPHAGRIDLATYDVTLHWPASLTLLASGRPVDGGEQAGRHWTRRKLDTATMAFSFAIDDYDVVEDRAGHIAITFAFNRGQAKSTPEIRAEVIRAVKASLLFYETRLGWLPIDHMVVVAVENTFSQGLLGFITLADGMIHDTTWSLFDAHTAQERRLEVIAHEIAHQWWGHVVGWDSYRDQWLSEALAEFSAATFMSKIAAKPEVYYRRRATELASAWKKTTFDGRALASLGPVLLGHRLRENYGGAAYYSILYAKGPAIFSTLAQHLGTEATWQMLGSLTRAVGNRVIRTSTFFKALEHMSGQDLSAFYAQYVAGAGLPLLLYDYDTRGSDSGLKVEGHVRLFPPPQYRYVLRRSGAGWDVVRQTRTPAAGDVGVMVPYLVESANGARSTGYLEAKGETTPFSITVAERPSRFALDPDGQLFADVHADEGNPQLARTILAEHLILLGRVDEGLALLEVEGAESPEGGVELKARMRLVRARALLDRSDVEGAKRALRQAEELLQRGNNYMLGERVVLEARLDMRAGLHEAALTKLRDYVSEHASELARIPVAAMIDSSPFSEIKINRGEYLALLAVGSHLERDPDAALLIRLATIAGIDMHPLHRM